MEVPETRPPIRAPASHSCQVVPLRPHLDGPRVTAVLQLSARSFVHRVRPESAADVDATVWRWLRDAYAVGLMAGRRAG